MSQSRYAQLSRQELAVLVPELLLIGHMIDRSGMAWCIQEFGRDEMVQIAIEEWAGASPIYTRRMQRALNYEGDDVPTIFKGLQLDIGAPPQFMDFRYTIHDRWHGEFHLDHCGALLDVEPMGDDYVFGMCHTIEDPTFDATAVATNARAQVRPIHRPPRVPSDRHPHCAWTVVIDESYPPVESIPALDIVARNPRCDIGNSMRSIRPTRVWPTIPARWCPTSTSVPTRIRRWCGWPTRYACRCICCICLCGRSAGARGFGHRAGRLDMHPPADRRWPGSALSASIEPCRFPAGSTVC